MIISNKQYLLFCILFLIHSINAFSQNSQWEGAKWLWQEDEGPANTWVAFRKNFDIKDIPSDANIKIAVDTKYWLWVNGEMILFEGGLARGAGPNTNYFDIVDLSEYLKEGKNTIAVLVWYWGRTRKVHDDSGKGGLLVHADWGLKTNNTWKMKKHPAYDPKSGGGGKNPNRVNAYNVYFDARKALGDWTEKAWYTQNYDDSDWTTPHTKGNANDAPWGELVERSIPQWNDRGLTEYTSLFIGENEVKLPYKNQSDSVQIIMAQLPFNKQITPYIKLKSKEGKVIEIKTDNPFNLLKAKYTTTNGEQSFEDYSWINGHIVTYKIPSEVEVLELKYRWTGLGEMTGTFETNDSFYTRLWWMARNTLYICARDGYMDCPDRERGLWIGDVADQTGAIFYTMDEAGRKLLKKAIDNTVAYADGDTIQGLAPGFGAYRGKSSELACQSLQYIDQVVWQYYYNTGDKATLANAYPGILRYLGLWKMGEDGLPMHRKGYANWVDWGEDPDPVPMNVVWYYNALKAGKRMALVLGEEQDLVWYDQRIQSIKANFEGKYWRGTHYGSKGKPREERTTSMAVISGLANPKNLDIMVDSTLFPIQKASPHMEWLAEEALMKTGHFNKGLLRMKQRYEDQVNQEGLTTLYEKFNPKRRGTYNHAWNAPNYVLSRYIAGIKATDVAWASYEVKPNLAHFNKVKQLVPSVKGDIELEVTSNGNNYEMKLVSPANTTAKVYIPNTDQSISELKINGKVVWKNGKYRSKVKGIQWVENEKTDLTFLVEEGHWFFKAVKNEM
ncbi:alpha-L-rhamnosidase C-terminal domain-containing protein [Flammeovirga sp. OC4]|uniref:alpha-L-rhamnosidase-related protein n=1 Tax=Flammeovirga sp. OC4 TaxID=1382345 RepID=UPI0005C55A1F|nr:alpha-L-rhamnosidase C-terminal domain-containing protein [Flammeovirga sp. OC4]